MYEIVEICIYEYHGQFVGMRANRLMIEDYLQIGKTRDQIVSENSPEN